MEPPLQLIAVTFDGAFGFIKTFVDHNKEMYKELTLCPQKVHLLAANNEK